MKGFIIFDSATSKSFGRKSIWNKVEDKIIQNRHNNILVEQKYIWKKTRETITLNCIIPIGRQAFAYTKIFTELYSLKHGLGQQNRKKKCSKCT